MASAKHWVGRIILGASLIVFVVLSHTPQATLDIKNVSSDKIRVELGLNGETRPSQNTIDPQEGMTYVSAPILKKKYSYVTVLFPDGHRLKKEIEGSTKYLDVRYNITIDGENIRIVSAVNGTETLLLFSMLRSAIVVFIAIAVWRLIRQRFKEKRKIIFRWSDALLFFPFVTCVSAYISWALFPMLTAGCFPSPDSHYPCSGFGGFIFMTLILSMPFAALMTPIGVWVVLRRQKRLYEKKS